jgi:uncharacterized protein YfaS (alpha-2-macroglobulin family)
VRVLRWLGTIWIALLAVVVAAAGLALLARFALPLLPGTPPALHGTTPAAGAADVPPRTTITLRFSEPMNPPSVARALRLEPPAPAALAWDAAQTTLTISPTAPLAPDTTYTLTVGATAQSRLFRPLAAPAVVRFRTAPAPAVVAALPADGARDVPPDQPIVLHFSRPIVPPNQIGAARPLPELRFDPPLDGQATWLSPTTAIFRPDTPLRPGTRYVATLDAALADLAGTRLGRSFSWSFSTPAPTVRAVAPGDAARNISPRTPLVVRLSQPFDPAAIQASLTISPTIAGSVAAQTLPDATQVITFTPAGGWRPNTTYRAELRPGPTPPGGNLPLAAPVRWSFETAPEPRLIGQFPGAGQALPTGQEIRLIFNTPVDPESLRKALRFTPPAGEVHVTASDTEARIRATLRPATSYTLTVEASATDLLGTPLGRATALPLRTAPAAPALDLPEIPGHVATLAPGTPGILMRRVNLTGLTFDLYRLDEATAVRTLDFRPDDWAGFSPERYGQALVRSWTARLADPPDAPAESREPLAGAAPLEAGIYYLRVRTAEGPRADALLFVSPIRLLLQRSGAMLLIWAVDGAGAPRAGLPVTLYQDGVLIGRGTTDAGGRWLVPQPGGDPRRPYLALAAGDAPGVASSAWAGPSSLEPLPRRAFLMTDRAAYAPGEPVAVAGFVRGTGDPPRAAALALIRAATGERVATQTLPLPPSGVLSGTLTLPRTAAPGAYLAMAEVAGQRVTAPLRVAPPPDAPLRLAISGPAETPADAPVALTVAAAGPAGLPLAGVPVSWTLTAEPAAFAVPEGYIAGDDERVAPPAAPRAGAGVTGSDGRLVLVLSDTLQLDAPLRYRLEAHAALPDGPAAAATHVYRLVPAGVVPALQLPSRLLETGRPAEIEVLALDAGGQPAPSAPLRVEAIRRVWPPGAAPGDPPREERVLTRALRAGPDGRATLRLALAAPGEHRLIVSAGGAARRAAAAATVWVAGPGFDGWRPAAPGQARLIADRDAYRPGETARLLAAPGVAEGAALLALRAGETLTGTLRPIRAGEVLTATLPATDAPAAAVGVGLLGRDEARAAQGVLPLTGGGRALTLTLAADQASYAPGATAVLTVTARGADGGPAPADLILSVVPAASAPATDLPAAFAGAPPSPIATALGPGRAGPDSPLALPGPPASPDRGGMAAPILWRPGLRIGTGGFFTTTITMPSEPVRLLALAWAVGEPGRAAQAALPLEVRRPVSLELLAPTLLRASDRFELAARLRNGGPTTQAITLTLATEGVALAAGADATARVSIPPGEEVAVRWPALAGPEGRARVTLHAAPDAGAPFAAARMVEILPRSVAELAGGGALAEGSASAAIALPAGAGPGVLTVEVAPSARALARAVAADLALRPARSTLDDAGILLIGAALSETLTLAPDAVARLEAGQHADGGWGWWPAAPSEPRATLAALEALAWARAAGVPVRAATVERGLDALDAFNQTADAPELRAWAAYVRGLLGAALSPTAPPDDAAALAYALLGQPPGAAALADRLEQLAERDERGAYWPASAAGDPVGTTGLALLALERQRPESAMIEPARRWLAAALRPGGWGSGLASARALAGLVATEPAGAGVGYRVTLNGVELAREPAAAGAPATVRRASVPLAQLQAINTLAMSGTGYLAWRLAGAAPDAPQPAGGIALLREYLDPATGRSLAGQALRPGQMVRVRLTAVVETPQQAVLMEDALPGGTGLLAAGGGPLAFAGGMPGRLLFAAPALAPGAYQQSYLVQIGAAGSFYTPAPTARAGDGPTARGNSATLEVGGRE